MYSFDTREKLSQYIASEIVDTSEAIKILQCSRQNLDGLVKRGKLTPIMYLARTKIFFKEDVCSHKFRKRT